MTTFTSAKDLFQASFGDEPEVKASAPGRVNLIGEYTDIAEGFVLPSVLPQETQVCLSIVPTGQLVGVTTFQETRKTRGMNTDKDGSWTDYVLGCVRQVEKLGYKVPGLNVAVHSDVPAGAGVSSSAALEVATLRALREALDLKIDDKEIARMGQRVENDFVGVMCGLMDQMVCSVGQPNHALFFDTRTLETKNIPLFKDHSFVVIHSGIKRQLVDGAYNERFDACTRAADAFGVDALRDADMSMVLQLDGLDGQRARHVVRENDLVLNAVQALEDGDTAYFGEMMTESHWSLSRDFETSLSEIDAMVQACNDNGAVGARITGAGFGGCIVVLVEHGKEAKMLAAAKAAQPDASLVAMVSC